MGCIGKPPGGISFEGVAAAGWVADLIAELDGHPEAAEKLKHLTGPFVLRRLKTDKTIIADLPEKMEMKVFCTLIREQASLYEAVVKEAIRD